MCIKVSKWIKTLKSVFNGIVLTYYPPIISRSSELALPWDHGLLLQRDGQNLKISTPPKDDFWHKYGDSKIIFFLCNKN